MRMSAVETEEMCQLVAADKQCGEIFINKVSLLLKFRCKLCSQTYDDINYFCSHLSEHVTAEDDEYEEGIDSDIRFHAEKKESRKIYENKYDYEELGMTLAEQAENEFNSSNQDPLYTTEDIRLTTEDIRLSEEVYEHEDEEDDISEMVVEELDEANEIAQEFREDTNTNNELKQKGKQTWNWKVEQCDNAFQLSNDSKNTKSRQNITRSEPKKRKVTTVKVIAVRNRVTELYEKIKADQEKGFQNKNQDRYEREHFDGKSGAIDLNLWNQKKLTESLPKMKELENLNYSGKSSQQKFVQKIVGETVITLIPDGCHLSEMSTPTILQKQELQNQVQLETLQDDCTCPACGKRFRSSFSLAIHKRSHYLESNSNIKLAHKCSDCDRLFNKISDLREHVEKMHFPEGFICKICNKQLTSLNLLEIHMRKVHLHREFCCNHCGKTFENFAAYETHANVPNGCGYNYRCQICGRKYTNNRTLSQHMSNHKEQVPQTCVVCGKETLRITQHMKIHAPRPKRINRCNICGKCFNFSSGLSNHYRLLHRQQRVQQKSRNTKTCSKRNNLENLILNGDEINFDASKDNAVTSYKEVDAKRVIVEMIEGCDPPYKTLGNENNWSSEMVTAPPIAREETISAVNSIVDHL